MVAVRVLKGVAGMDFSWRAGQVVDLPEEEAAKWADGVRAERVAPETTSQPRPETTTSPRPAKTTARRPERTVAE